MLGKEAVADHQWTKKVDERKVPQDSALDDFDIRLCNNLISL
jgi:hypothetical protein